MVGLALPAHGMKSADTLIEYVAEPWFGDYSAMKKDKVVRVLIPYSITSYHKALALKLDFPEVHSNLGTALKELARIIHEAV